MIRFATVAALYLAAAFSPVSGKSANGTVSYPIVDTGQMVYYGAMVEIAAPQAGAAFYGQDAQHAGNQASYQRSSDGKTVTDNVTGLVWQSSPDADGDGFTTADDKLTPDAATAYVGALNESAYGGYTDWRLPTIKELYSLILFSGTDPVPEATTTDGLTPFIDTTAFDFGYGDVSAGERIIDAQYVSATRYVSTTMNGNETVFGVNFADGRIKGYGVFEPLLGEKEFFVKCVRGNASYGVNEFTDNGDGTVVDSATGLMWSQDDSKGGVDWQAALSWVQERNTENYLGHSGWRLPDAKELQSIVDYSWSPATTSSAAIDSVFASTAITNEAGDEDWPVYWTGTTHRRADGTGSDAVYVAFGRAMGYMGSAWLDVHGAGAQRADLKAGDPSDFPTGRGPQGDAIRILNYVRLVRDAGTETTPIGAQEGAGVTPTRFELAQNAPNPFNPSTVIRYDVPQAGNLRLRVFSMTGQVVRTLVDRSVDAGMHEATWDGRDDSGLPVGSGVYVYRLEVWGELDSNSPTNRREAAARRMTLVR